MDPEASLRTALTDDLHGEVAAMNRANFLVRMHLAAVERYQDRTAWNALSAADRVTLHRDVAGLPSEIEPDKVESRHFDLLLEAKGSTIPTIAAQLAFLGATQETAFWEGMTAAALEEIRLRLRHLVPLLDRRQRTIVYTDFKEEVLAIRDEKVVYIPKMTGAQYEKKVKNYLQNHLDQMVIYRLRRNQPLTTQDLKALESTLAAIGEDDGATLLSDLLARSAVPPLAHFVRSLVGMDRAAA